VSMSAVVDEVRSVGTICGWEGGSIYDDFGGILHRSLSFENFDLHLRRTHSSIDCLVGVLLLLSIVDSLEGSRLR